MRGTAPHNTVHQGAQFLPNFAASVHVQKHRRILKDHPADWLQGAVRCCAKHLQETRLLARVHQLVDAAVTLNHLQVELLLNLILHVQDTLAHDAVEDAAVVRRSNKLNMAKAALLNHKQVERSALLDIVVQQPEHVVVPVVFGVTHCGHQGAQVACKAVRGVTQRPIFVHSYGAFELDRLDLLKGNGVQDSDDFGVLRRADTKSFVSAEVSEADVKLIWFVHPVDPFLVELNEGFEALF